MLKKEEKFLYDFSHEVRHKTTITLQNESTASWESFKNNFDCGI